MNLLNSLLSSMQPCRRSLTSSCAITADSSPSHLVRVCSRIVCAISALPFLWYNSGWADRECRDSPLCPLNCFPQSRHLPSDSAAMTGTVSLSCQRTGGLVPAGTFLIFISMLVTQLISLQGGLTHANLSLFRGPMSGCAAPVGARKPSYRPSGDFPKASPAYGP